MRDIYLGALLHQDAEFFDSRQAGELTTRLNADVQAIQSGTSEKVGICIACISFFLTAYIVAFIKVWKLAAMLLSLIPAFLLSAAVCSHFTEKYTTKMSQAIEGASSIASESLSHIAVVQAFGAGPRLETKFRQRMSEAEKWGIKKAFVAAVQAGLLYFIAYSANGLAFWQGSKMIVESLREDSSGTTMGQIYTVIFLLVDGKFALSWADNARAELTRCSLCYSWIHCASSPAASSSFGFVPEAPRRHRDPCKDRLRI